MDKDLLQEVINEIGFLNEDINYRRDELRQLVTKLGLAESFWYRHDNHMGHFMTEMYDVAIELNKMKEEED